jgi:hypothetical protein
MPKPIWRKGMIVVSEGGTLKAPLRIGSIEHKKDIWGKPLTEYKMQVERGGKWVYAITVGKAWLDSWAVPVSKKDKTNPIRVHIGKSYKDAVISKKKPKNSVKVGETKSYKRYVLGANEYLVAKHGYELVKGK